MAREVLAVPPDTARMIYLAGPQRMPESFAFALNRVISDGEQNILAGWYFDQDAGGWVDAGHAFVEGDFERFDTIEEAEAECTRMFRSAYNITTEATDE